MVQIIAIAIRIISPSLDCSKDMGYNTKIISCKLYDDHMAMLRTDTSDYCYMTYCAAYIDESQFLVLCSWKRCLIVCNNLSWLFTKKWLIKAYDELKRIFYFPFILNRKELLGSMVHGSVSYIIWNAIYILNMKLCDNNPPFETSH